MGINNVIVNDVYLLSTRGMSKTEKTSSSNILIQFYQLTSTSYEPSCQFSCNENVIRRFVRENMSGY